MGGGFMADIKDKTMQEQKTHPSFSHRKRPLHPLQQQHHPFRHIHQAPSPSNPNPLLPPPPLKVIFKLPHSSPSPSSTPSSPLSRPSPLSSELPKHHHLSSPAPASPSTSPSQSSSPSSSPIPALPSAPRPHCLTQRQKLTSELPQYHHSQQPHRPAKPPLQQIKHSHLDSKHYPSKKLRELNSQLQLGRQHGRPNPSLERASPKRQQVSLDLKNPQEESAISANKREHSQGLAKSREKKCTGQPDLSIAERYNSSEQEDDEISVRRRQVDSAYVSRKPGQAGCTDLANPYLLGSEKVQDSNHSRRRGDEPTDQAIEDWAGPTEELELSHKQAEEVDQRRSRAKRLEEVWQLDEGAVPKRPQRPQQLAEHDSHTVPVPKRLRSSAHHHHLKHNKQGQQQQEQERLQSGSPKVTPLNKSTHIASQQHPFKKLTQSSSLQGPHGLHQSSKLSSQTTTTSSPHPVASSTPASMQSSAQSLSTSAVSDEAHKPSKKRKLQALLELESTDGQSVAVDGTGGQLHVNSAMPAAAAAADLPVVQPSMEINDSKEYVTENPSPKQIVHDLQLLPARRLLNNFLDRLQKKDKVGVFAEPVDAKEVPNYHDIIKEPMDFGTMRSRVSSGHYTSMELFQKDVFLICDNAMQYNGKGTVYYRRARSIKDIAERILEDLKVSGLSVELDEPAAKVRSGGTGKSSEKHESRMTTGSPSDAQLDQLEEFSGYVLRNGCSADGRRSQAFDENRRSTYLSTSTYSGNDSLINTIGGDSSHLVPTGYQMDLPYSKSLARFAADLGPLVWKIAAEKIRKALPPGCPFGQGWVGEKESGGVALAPSGKLQSTTHQTAKLSSENGTAATSDLGLSSAPQEKLDGPFQSHVGNLQTSHEVTMSVESKSVVHALAKLPNEARSPMVLANPLGQHERPDKSDPRILGQPAAQPISRSHNSDNSIPVGQAYSQPDKDLLVKFVHTSGSPGKKLTIAGQVNLNHPVSAHPDEIKMLDHVLPKQDGLGTSSSSITPISKTASLPFNLGGAFSPMPPHREGMGPVKAVSGETGLNTAARGEHFAGKGMGQFSRSSLLNDSPTAAPTSEAALRVTNNGKKDINYQPNTLQMLRGSVMPHNLNMPAQPPCGINDVHASDGNGFDPARLKMPLSHSVQGFSHQHTSNTPIQHVVSSQQSNSGNHVVSSQQSNSGNHLGARDTGKIDQSLSAQPAPTFLERAVGERLKETGDLLREKEMLSLAGRMPAGVLSSNVGKGLINSERGFTIQQVESKNGQASNHDLTNIQSFDQLNRKQSISGAFPIASFSPGLPTSNGGLIVRDGPVWKPTQPTDSTPLTGKGQNQVIRRHADQHEANPAGVQFMRPHTSGGQDLRIYGHGSVKQVSNMPHFLQQQLGTDNLRGFPNQLMKAKPQVQSNSLVPGGQMLSSLSDSQEANLARQFQLSGQRGFAQAGSPAWQYMSSQPMAAAHGSHQSFSAAPDLNVSLPLAKSPFDQSGGNEIQQPDLALQL